MVAIMTEPQELQRGEWRVERILSPRGTEEEEGEDEAPLLVVSDLCSLCTDHSRWRRMT
jgi:hypothetical protein